MSRFLHKIGYTTGLTTLLAGTYAYQNAKNNKIEASEDVAHPPEYPWHHEKYFGSYDAASIRRGYKVYKQVCSACHSMNEIAFRNLSIAFTEDEIKELAGQCEVPGDPDEEGNPTTRAAKPFDTFPSPYANEQQARALNQGALPPDLSVIVKAREGGENYIFSLLLGYDETPPGTDVGEGKYYNAYFPGGAIGMAPPLVNGALEFEDGTPATVSQMAKDVTTFLAYCAKPEQEERKKTGIKTMASLAILMGLLWTHKRFKWNIVKNRTVVFRD